MMSPNYNRDPQQAPPPGPKLIPLTIGPLMTNRLKDSRSSPARIRPRISSPFHPMSPFAINAGRNFLTPLTAATATHSSTAPTAAPVSRLSKISPMTDPRPPWLVSRCVRSVVKNMRTRVTAGSMPSRSPARSADRWSGWKILRGTIWLKKKTPSGEPAKCWLKERSWQSKGWAAFTWPVTLPTRCYRNPA